jgi:hypothetical protein
LKSVSKTRRKPTKFATGRNMHDAYNRKTTTVLYTAAQTVAWCIIHGLMAERPVDD